MTAASDYDVLNKLAYQSWLDRGQPVGSPDIDWEYACNLLRASPTPPLTPSVSSQQSGTTDEPPALATAPSSKTQPPIKATAGKKAPLLDGITRN